MVSTQARETSIGSSTNASPTVMHQTVSASADRIAAEGAVTGLALWVIQERVQAYRESIYALPARNEVRKPAAGAPHLGAVRQSDVSGHRDRVRHLALIGHRR